MHPYFGKQKCKNLMRSSFCLPITLPKGIKSSCSYTLKFNSYSRKGEFAVMPHCISSMSELMASPFECARL